MLMTGPPGAGKTLLARALPGILPPMTPDETLEVTRIYSVAGVLGPATRIVRLRPYRIPASVPGDRAGTLRLTYSGPPLTPEQEVEAARFIAWIRSSRPAAC